MPRCAPLVRGSLFVLSLGAVGRVLWGFLERHGEGIPLVPRDLMRPAQLGLDRLVVVSALVAVVVAAAALLLSAALTVLSSLAEDLVPTGVKWAARLTPVWWRRVVLAACGLGVSMPAAAQAELALPPPPGLPAVTHGDEPCAPGESHVLNGLPLPDLPDLRRDRVVTVRRGDSLWVIARRQLTAGSSDATVLWLVHVLYASNRPEIGPDPNLIFPGSRLTAPGGFS